MSDPRVRPQRPNPFDKLKDDLVNDSKRQASKNARNTSMDLQSRLAQNEARHTAEEYAPAKQSWTRGVIDSDIYLKQEMVGDDEIRDRIGLPDNISMDMIRTDPNLWAMFPHAEQRLRQIEQEQQMGISAEAEENKNWISKGLGFLKDGALNTGIKVGEAYDLLWKPADMLNEKLEHWFPEDATGTRKYLGHILGATVVPGGFIWGSQEGGMPRMPTPKQIQGMIQDSMADLNMFDNEQNELYKKRIIELKAEGMSDDKARIQAFEERTDIPGWFKFTLPMMSDPLTYTGIGGVAKSVAKGSARAAKGIKSGFRQKHTGKIWEPKAAEQGPKNVMPEAPEAADIIKRASEGTGPSALRRLTKLFDPSGELKHLKEGDPRRVVLGAVIAGKHGQEFAERSGSFLKQQAEGTFGKLDTLWGKSVLDDDQGVLVQRLTQKDYAPLAMDGSETLSSGFKIKKTTEYELEGGRYGADPSDWPGGSGPVDFEDIASIEEGSLYRYGDEFEDLGQMADELPLENAFHYEIVEEATGVRWAVIAEPDVVKMQRDKLGRFMPGGRKGVEISIERIIEDSDVIGDISELTPGTSFINPQGMKEIGEVIARDFPDRGWFHGTRMTEGHRLSQQFIPIELFGRAARRPAKLVADDAAPKVRVPLSDVIEQHQMFNLSAEQRAFTNYFNDVFEQFGDLAKKEGMDLPSWGTLGEAMGFMSRATKGFRDENGVQLLKEIPRSPGAPGPGRADFMKKRAFEEMQDGLNEGWLYENVYDALEIYGRSFFRQVATNRMETHLMPITRGVKAEDVFPTFMKQNKYTQRMMEDQTVFMKELQDFISMGGTKFNPNTAKKVKAAFAPLVDDTEEIRNLKNSVINDIDKVLKPEYKLWTDAIDKLAASGALTTGITGQALKAELQAIRKAAGGARIKKNIGIEDINEAVKKLNVSDSERRRMVRDLLKGAGDEVRMQRKGQLDDIYTKMESILPDSKAALARVKQDVDLKNQIASSPNVRTEAASAMFPNRIFTNQMGNDAKGAALQIDKAFLDDGGEWIKHMANANAAIRFVKTTADLGAPLIQGLPILFTDSAAWGKALGMQFNSLKNPAVRSRYVADNATEVAEFLKYGMHIGSSEMTEALAQGGWLAALPRVGEKGLSRIGLGENPGASTTRQIARNAATIGPRAVGFAFSRAQTAFDTYLDVARIEVMKGLKPVAMASKDPHKAMADLAQFSNKLTGIVSTKAMGVSATQRGIESSILMFSPRYTRAIGALFIDMTRGGLKGGMARKAMASLFAGQVALHAAAAAATDQEMNLMPGSSNFLKIKVGDDWVGFGGKANSLMNMAADVSIATLPNPDKYMDIKSWSKDSLGTVFKRGRYMAAPLGGEAMSFITGQDAIGQTMPDLEDFFSDPTAFPKYAGTVVAPFWGEAALEANPTGTFGEFFGAAVTPMFPKQRLDELREKLIKEKYGAQFPGIDWDRFKKLPTYRSKYALLLEENPELKEAEEYYESESKKYAYTQQRTQYQGAISQIRTDSIKGRFDENDQLVEQGYDQIATEFLSGANGRRTGEVFRRKMSVINEIAQNRRRDEQQKYPQMMADREEYYKGASKENIVTAARNEFYDFLTSPRATDAFGNVNHEAIEIFKKEQEQRYEKYGKGMGKIVADELKFTNDQQLMETPEGADIPKVIQEYYKSWDVLKPYWRIYEEVIPEENWKEWQLFAGSSDQQKTQLRLNPNYRRWERRVEIERTRLRRQNYEIDKFLTMFHDYAPENPRREREIIQSMRESRRGGG